MIQFKGFVQLFLQAFAGILRIFWQCNRNYRILENSPELRILKNSEHFCIEWLCLGFTYQYSLHPQESRVIFAAESLFHPPSSTIFRLCNCGFTYTHIYIHQNWWDQQPLTGMKGGLCTCSHNLLDFLDLFLTKSGLYFDMSSHACCCT